MAQDDLRTLFGPEAPVMEAMAEAAFPGATIDWDAQTLVRPGVDPEPVEFVGYQEEEWRDGRLAIAAIQFPREIREIVGQALEGKGVVSGATPPRVVVVQLASDRTIVDDRVGILDAGGLATECNALFPTPGLDETVLPSIEIELKSIHVGSSWVASIVWIGRFDGESMALVRLIPLLFSRQHSDGTVNTDVFELEEISATELELTGQTTGATWSVTCDPDCIVPVEVILGE